MLNNKTFLRIFSLVAAVMLWVYVMLEVDPYKTAKIDEIPITFVNEDLLAEEGLAPITDESAEVAVKIKGRRSDVNDVRKAGLTAYVDVSSCKKGKNTGEIVVNTPDGISIEAISEEYFTFKVDELSEEEKTLNVEFENHRSGNEKKVPWIVTNKNETVTVTGAESLVNKVESVKGTASSENIPENRSEWRDVSVIAVDKNGNEVAGVSIENDNHVQVKVRLMTLKSAELEISAESINETFEMDKLDVAEKIRIVGPAEIIKNIDKIEGVADLTDINDTETHKISVNLDLPDGIYLYDKKNPMTVKVKLKAVE